MILLAGGTGRLGALLVDLLLARYLPVRVLTREPARARHLPREHVEIFRADLRDRDAVDRAVSGARTVISAVQGGFGATGGSTPTTVDLRGNGNLIDAARAHGVEHFVLVSIIDAAADHPLELWRMKYLAEQKLKASGLAWTIIRATAFMEWCVGLIGDPLWKTGRTRIFGAGNNPINFVSAHDVARFVERAVVDPTLRGQAVEVVGPEDLTFNEVLERIRTVTETSGTASHVPLLLMRIMSRVLTPINPALAREIRAGVFLDTADRTAAASASRAAYPSIPMTNITEVIRRQYATHQQGQVAATTS
jgi:NADH dehydrogenase